MIGRAARERRAAGGKRAVGRDSLPSVVYNGPFRDMLLFRARAHCEACGSPRITREIEHALPRSAGGADTWGNCWIPCGPAGCGDAVSKPYETGRLIREALGEGLFRFTWVKATSKQAFFRGNFTVIRGPVIGGRRPTPEERVALQAMGAL